jgi:glycerol-3-phosphate O-acyltransferase
MQKVIRDMAGEGATERRVLGFRALAMLREMEAEVDPNALRALDAACEQTISRMYSEFEIDDEGLERVREAAKDGTVVLLPSHKSHIDYIILTRLFYQSNLPVPLVAAGDNLAFFPLGPILRRAGAYFIRRSFKGDRLYGAVVDAYMRRLLKDGWPLEFFLEGGRSRTGKLLPPKLGLLSIVVDAVLGAREGGETRKVYFVPISIGYERVPEERAYVHEVSGGEKRKEDVGGLLRAAESALGRYGKLNVQFGELLTIDNILEEIARESPKRDEPVSSGRPKANGQTLTPAKRRALVTRLAYRTMNEINRVTAVTPSAVVATALLTHGKRGLAHDELIEASERIARVLAEGGARLTPSLRADASARRAGATVIRREAVREACELLGRAGHIEVYRPGVPVGDKANLRPGPDAFYIVPPEARLSLDIAKNLLVHFFVSRAMIAIPLAARSHGEFGERTARQEGEPPKPPSEMHDRALLSERAQALSRLFKYEFQFRADASFDTIFAETLDAMAADGEIERDDAGNVRLATTGEGRERAVLQARVVRNFVEGYRVAARSLSALLKGPLTPKDLAKRAMTTGEKMFLAGEIEFREAISRPVVENAFLAFVDQGYLGRLDGKYVLPESYATPETVRTIESRISSYL